MKNKSLMTLLDGAGFTLTAALAVFAFFSVAAAGPNTFDHPVTATAPAAPALMPGGPRIAADALEIPVITVAQTQAAADPAGTGIDEAVAVLEAAAADIDYERARFDPLHFAPLIGMASDEECLVCHNEIMTHKPRDASPAGLKSDAVLAWYQTLDTYAGAQESFHYRHLESPFAQEVMSLTCNFCHKGNDPREETPDMLVTRAPLNAPAVPEFTLRKMVNPSQTCLRCHGAMPDPENIMTLWAPWPEARVDFEDEETPNGCLSCHEDIFRTVRHEVTYLKAAAIEEAAKRGSDVCYGCHGGRQWYRISYPYPRHPWPDMDDDETPDWADGRPTESDPEYRLTPVAAQ